MKHIRPFKEATHYHKLSQDDEYEITRTIRDDHHNYQYCDGILYELSGNDSIVDIDLIEETEGNLFYEDQIERYIEYFERGGICQTFPVDASPLGGCRNLEEMLEYLEEPDNFDMAWEILSKYHRKLFDINKFDITDDPEAFGFNDELKLSDIRDQDDLDMAYNEDRMENPDRDADFDEELYDGFVAILDHWQDAKEYTLIDFNHRFNALKRMGKTKVMIEEM